MEQELDALDAIVKQEILADENLHRILEPYFPNKQARIEFIDKSLKKQETREMLLITQEYIEISDGMEKVKPGRLPLKIVFLIALAEGVVKRHLNKIEMDGDTKNDIVEFFRFTSSENQKKLLELFKRSDDKDLNFIPVDAVDAHPADKDSIITILYNVRNDAVHGKDFWSFSLISEEDKQKFEKDSTDVSWLTSGKLGPRNKKQEIFLDTSLLTYKELRAIFIENAITLINSFNNKENLLPNK